MLLPLPPAVPCMPQGMWRRFPWLWRGHAACDTSISRTLGDFIRFLVQSIMYTCTTSLLYVVSLLLYTEYYSVCFFDNIRVHAVGNDHTRGTLLCPDLFPSLCCLCMPLSILCVVLSTFLDVQSYFSFFCCAGLFPFVYGILFRSTYNFDVQPGLMNTEGVPRAPHPHSAMDASFTVLCST